MDFFWEFDFRAIIDRISSSCGLILNNQRTLTTLITINFIKLTAYLSEMSELFKAYLDKGFIDDIHCLLRVIIV
jgi:hypothetical protein